jgi:nitroreductase
MQNWRLTLARGEARKRVVTALREEAEVKGPNIPALPEAFAHFRSELGQKLYGEEGYNIRREEKERHKQAVLRNYEFFGAPVCGVISMHHDLTNVDALSVGMFVQTFVLALTERGLGACLQVSVTGYPEILRRELKLSDDQKILCGIAIGYPATDNKVNNLVMMREDVEKQVTFHNE